jgi:hypothetical protein
MMSHDSAAPGEIGTNDSHSSGATSEVQAECVRMSSSLSTDEKWAGSVAVATYLASDQGRADVAQAARRHRLGTALEHELASRVQDAAFNMDRRGQEIRSPVGFVHRVLEMRAIDLVRGEIRRRRRFARPTRDDDGDQPAFQVAAPEDPALTELEHEGALARIRDIVLDHRVEGSAWQRSALLTYVAVRVDGLEPGERCVRPRGGTTPHKAALWAGLWYAGKRASLEGDGANDAVRQARSRQLRALGDLHDQVRTIVRGEHG